MCIIVIAFGRPGAHSWSNGWLLLGCNILSSRLWLFRIIGTCRFRWSCSIANFSEVSKHDSSWAFCYRCSSTIDFCATPLVYSLTLTKWFSWQWCKAMASSTLGWDPSSFYGYTTILVPWWWHSSKEKQLPVVQTQCMSHALGFMRIRPSYMVKWIVPVVRSN